MREAAWTTWTVVCFTLGLVQEEQAARHHPLGDRLAEAVSPTAHPALHRSLGHLDADSFDERFEYGLTGLLG
ncbi:hypothetical protein ACIQVT_12990 [Streptomyces sp. NPDC100445]|uniref:hypothetical protein n=1 Tax=Streptomyces sp. NPDC100445 TaxID=3366102 RepID=UPI00381DEEE3